MRGSRRSWRSTRSAVGERHARAHDAPSISTRNASSRSSVRVSSQKLVGRRLREDPPIADQHELVAAIGLVHHVARDEQRRAGVREPAERAPEVAAKHRVETDRRLVEDEQVRPAEQRCRERHARALAAGERAHRPPRQPNEIDGLEHLLERVPERPRRSARSSRGSRARSGRRRPRAPASRSRRAAGARGAPAGRPSTSTVPLRDRPARRRSRASASSCPTRSGPSRPVMRARRHLEAHGPERVRRAADDVELAHTDCGHAATITP